jgi:hypothetical protein
MTDAPLSSHYGKCRCDGEPALGVAGCGAINEFRSDFTYKVGDWIGLRCKACGRSAGVGQRVVELTTGLSPEALEHIRNNHL